MKDSVIILRLKSDDREAFERLFRRYHQSIYKFIYYFIGSSDKEATETAKDLMQDVYLKIWEHRHQLDCNKPIKPFLYRIARNFAINYLRHRQIVAEWEKTELQSQYPTFPSPDLIFDERELNNEIRKAIQKLPERCALIFTLSRYEDLSYLEIADVLNISLQTVKNQISKALSILRNKLTKSNASKKFSLQ